MVKSRYIGDGHPTFNRNPYNGYINPYYWVDDHPLLYANNGSLDPGTHREGCHQMEANSLQHSGDGPGPARFLASLAQAHTFRDIGEVGIRVW